MSLVVCVFKERDLIERLLQKAAGCYDELLVVHDGPDTTVMRGLVEKAGGRFCERPLAYKQEPHWPFAWGEAANDWILRLDADEFPSQEMKAWLGEFRRGGEPLPALSGFTCGWPVWNGRKAISRKWPAGRNFLFHRQRVRFCGMPECVPIADGVYKPLDLVLHHQPMRKSHGFSNLFLRRQAYRWRSSIAHSLLGSPVDLPCWRWGEAPWPDAWEEIRRHPLITACKRLTKGTLLMLREQWRQEGRFFPAAALLGPVHHTLICVEYWRLSRKRVRSGGR